MAAGLRGRGVEGAQHGAQDVAYKAFLVPGVLAQSVLFIAIFSGMAIIWERDLTYLVEILRQLLVGIGPNRLLFDAAVLMGVIVVAVAIANRTFPRRVL